MGRRQEDQTEERLFRLICVEARAPELVQVHTVQIDDWLSG